MQNTYWCNKRPLQTDIKLVFNLLYNNFEIILRLLDPGYRHTAQGMDSFFAELLANKTESKKPNKIKLFERTSSSLL